MTTRFHYWVMFVDTYRTPAPLEFNCATWAEFWALLAVRVQELGPVEHMVRVA